MKTLKDNINNLEKFALKIHGMLNNLGFFNSLNNNNLDLND